jgi:tellurite resistance protein TerC
MSDPSSTSIPTWAWLLFGATVTILLAIDLWAYRGRRTISRRITLSWSVIWIAAGLAFGGLVWSILGLQLVQEYYAAYALEKSLSLDNIFLFYVIFQSLNIPPKFQHKVLFWGILGAIGFRGLFIFLGIAAIERWEWVLYGFAALLLVAAWKAFHKNPATKEKSHLVAWLSQHLPIKDRVESGNFFTRNGGGWAVTPLFVALIGIELTDVMFAIDSVPAALSITHNRFVVYSSNIFAILGLRALYLFLAATIMQWPYLHYGLAAVLAFAALKILAHKWIYIPPLVSLVIIATLIGGAIWASLIRSNGKERE